MALYFLHSHGLILMTMIGKQLHLLEPSTRSQRTLPIIYILKSQLYIPSSLTQRAWIASHRQLYMMSGPTLLWSVNARCLVPQDIHQSRFQTFPLPALVRRSGSTAPEFDIQKSSHSNIDPQCAFWPLTAHREDGPVAELPVNLAKAPGPTSS